MKAPCRPRKTLVPLAEAVVHTREVTVKSAKSTPVETAAAVKSTHSAAVEAPPPPPPCGPA